MSKNEDKEEKEEKAVIEKRKKEIVIVSQPPTKKQEIEKPKPIPVMTFDRYFATLGKPDHHKAGMRAYLSVRNLKGKKSVEAWNRLLDGY